MDLKEDLEGILEEAISDSFVATLDTTPQRTDKVILSEEACIISSIGFAGTLDGSFSICLPYSSARKIVSKMLQMEIDEVNEDVIDGIGEQVNMIAGGVKMKLSESDHDFEISIPTVIKGNRMVILSDFAKTTMITLNYNFEDIMFSISLIYKIHKDRDAERKAKQQAREEVVAKLNQLVDAPEGSV